MPMIRAAGRNRPEIDRSAQLRHATYYAALFPLILPREITLPFFASVSVVQTITWSI
jgi:hypothetical protein